ncbi:MAG: glucans biosynthesis glucosyltransferase MdoH [Acetobacteraceae bacterium]|nr:glucans biosynthesis glucosyltransferase MdoH [Acetobacteraceae bacterium]
MLFRRLLVVAIVATVCLCLGVSMFRVLAPGGWTAAKVTLLLSCLAAAPWVGFCAANGLIGFVLRLRRPSVPPAVATGGIVPRTAIAVTVRNEDMAAVLPPVRRLLDGLDLAGIGGAFAVFILSDTNAPNATEAEERAAASFQAQDRDPSRIHYRRRNENSGFKAGNIMEFLDHRAEGFELMLVLDADSVMTPEAVLRLVLAMRDDPSLGIIQHLTVGLPASSAFPRMFQFGMRAGMRTWATALSWWQGDECVYWGHNAVIRIAPFRTHCRLPLLPGGAHILSHDQIEAAMLRGAGWGIRLLPEEDGSYEANPPALPEFMRREMRWLAGNFEYRHLLTMAGLRPMGRWQLIQAILLFGCTPFYVVFLLAAAWAAATDTTSPFPFGWALTATLIWAGALYAPKLLGYLEVLLSREKRGRYGGVTRVLAGAASEIVFTLLMDAINIPAKTVVTLKIALGLRATWTPQNRTDRGVSWLEAAHLLWPQTLLGFAVFACFAQAGWTAVLWAAIFALGLVVAIPFCVVTAQPAVSAWLRTKQLAAIPEELS